MMHDWYVEDGRMSGMADGTEWWQWALVFATIAVMLVVGAGVVLLVVTLRDIGAGRRRESHDPARAPAALHGDELILAERLARGEIDEAEFLARRHEPPEPSTPAREATGAHDHHDARLFDPMTRELTGLPPHPSTVHVVTS